MRMLPLRVAVDACSRWSRKHAGARAALLCALYLQSVYGAPVTYQKCSCEDCNCQSSTGCTCKHTGGSTGSFYDGICGTSLDSPSENSCLDWARVACHQEQDLTGPARPAGAECIRDAAGSEGMNGNCMLLDANGAESAEIRCSREAYWFCRDKGEGEPCYDDGTSTTIVSKGSRCGRAGTGLALKCMTKEEHPCLGKADGAECGIQFTGIDFEQYSSQHYMQSVCLDGVCLGPEIGACRNKMELDSCSYSVLEDEEKCTKPRTGKENCKDRGGTEYRDLYRVEMSGTCKGAFSESRTCAVDDSSAKADCGDDCSQSPTPIDTTLKEGDASSVSAASAQPTTRSPLPFVVSATALGLLSLWQMLLACP